MVKTYQKVTFGQLFILASAHTVYKPKYPLGLQTNIE